MGTFDKVKKNLEDAGYAVSVFSTGVEACAYLEKEICGKTVGFGGSVTLQQIGILEKLKANNQVFSHWSVPDGMSAEDARVKAMTTQIYLSSANGLAETGEIINIDGTCNRVAGTLFGHEKVYLVIGKNKLAPDYDAALYRARNVSAPKNAQRLKRNTPCAEKGDKCYNCNSPERICRALTVFWKKPNGCKYEIVLVDENLGF